MRNILFTGESVKMNWFNSENYFFTGESVKRQITDSSSENLTDSDLESRVPKNTSFLGIFWCLNKKND